MLSSGMAEILSAMCIERVIPGASAYVNSNPYRFPAAITTI